MLFEKYIFISIGLSFLFQEESDLPYEEDILRNPYSVKCWLRYIEHKKDAPKNIINMIYERAIKEMPGRLVLAFILLHKMKQNDSAICYIYFH